MLEQILGAEVFLCPLYSLDVTSTRFDKTTHFEGRMPDPIDPPHLSFSFGHNQTL
jgi:hypothetical protein